MISLAKLGMEFDTSSAKPAKVNLKDLHKESEKLEGQTKKTAKATDQLNNSFSGMGKSLVKFLGAYVSVRAALGAAEAFTGLTNSLKALGFSGDAAGAALEKIADIANRTRTPLQSVATLYQRVSIAGKDLGASQEKVLRFTENVGLALAQQGGSAEAASGALLQLSQALSGGVVRAEEFNSILEGAFPIAQAAANAIEGAAGSVGKLRSMVIAGEVSSREFFDALLSQSDALEEAFGNTVPTIGQAFTVLNNNFTLMIGQMNTASGVTEAIAKAILFLADNLDRLAVYAAVAAVGFGTYYVGALIAAAGATGTLSFALGVLKKALITSGIGILIVGVGEMVFWFSKLVKSVGSFGAAFELIKDVAVEVWDRIQLGAQGLMFEVQSSWMAIQAGALDALAGIIVGTLNVTNKVIGAFVGAYEAVVAAWGLLPAAFKRIGALAINGLIDSIQTGIGGILGALNTLLERVNLPPIEAPDLSAWKAEVGAAVDVVGAAGTAFDEAFNKDYVNASGVDEAIKKTSADLSAASQLADEFGDVWTDAATKPLESVEALKDAVAGAGDAAGDTTESTDKLNSALANTDKAGGKAGKKLKEMKTELEAYTDALKEAAYTAEDFGKAKADIMIGGIDGVSDAFGDFVARGFSDFKSFAKSILSSFTGMISKMVSMAARNRIMIGMGITPDGVSGIAGQLLGGGSSGSGGGGLIGSLTSGLGSFVSGIGSGLQSALGLGGFASNGIFSVAANAAQAVATGVGSFAASIGAALPVIGLAIAAFSFFKKSVKELDAGLRVTADGMTALVESFRTTETKRFWGLSKKVATTYEDADDEVANPIQKSVDQIGLSIKSLATVLNLEADNIDNAAYQFEISTKGKTEAEIQQAIEAELINLSDAFVNAIVGTYEEVIEDSSELMALKDELEALQSRGEGGGKGADMRFADDLRALQNTINNTETSTTVTHINDAFAGLIREGEGSYNTLIALAGSLELVNGTFDELGFTLFEASLMGANAARTFADAFGGWEAFSESMGFYIDTFYSDAEKLEIVTNRVSQALEGLNPNNINTAMESRDLFKALADWAGSGAAADSDQADMFAKLINAAPLIDQMFTLQDAVNGAADAADGATDAVEDLSGQLREADTLNRRLLTLQGDTAALRALDLAATHESNRAALESIHILEDKIAADTEAARIADEAAAAAANLAATEETLQKRYLELIGDTAALRALEMAALDESLRPMLQVIHLAEDRAVADAAAADATADLLAAEEALAEQREGIEAQILKLTGTTAEIRAAELAAILPGNRALQERLWMLEDQAEADELAASAEASRLSERERIQDRLNSLLDTTATIRERELAAANPSNVALLESLYLTEDLTAAREAEAEAAERLAEAERETAAEKAGLQQQIYQLHGNTMALRAAELAALSPANRELQNYIYTLEDAADAAEKAAAIASEKDGIERQILSLQGDTAALRALELASLAPSNRSLQNRVYALEDEATALEKIGRISDERYGLETQLLELQGDTATLRARELQLLHPSNRALQERIWALEDASVAEDEGVAALEASTEAMRAALGVLETAINEAVSGIQDAAEAEVSALQLVLDNARSAFDMIAAQFENAYDVVKASVDAKRVVAVAAYEAAIAGLDNRIESATANVQSLKTVFDILDGAISGRASSDRAIQANQLASAQKYLRAQNGAIPQDQDRLKVALDAVSGDTTKFYSNAEDYQREFLKTNIAIRKMRDTASAELTEGERTLEALESSKASREKQHSATIAALDEQLARAEAIYNEALGNTVAVMEVEDGIEYLSGIAAEFTAGQANLLTLTEQTENKIREIEDLASAQVSVLLAQLKTAQDEVDIAEGTYRATLSVADAIEDLAHEIAAYTAALAAGDEPPAFAAGGDHAGGRARIGENDIELVAPSRIYSPEQTRRLLSNENLVREIQAMRSDFTNEVSRLREENRQLLTIIAKTNSKLAKIETKRLEDEAAAAAEAE